MNVVVHTLERGKRDLWDSDRKTINWQDSSDRKWLMNHMHWAMHNNRTVTLIPEFV